MIRSELLERLRQAYPHLPRSVVELALETILNEITDRLAQGHRAELRGFGNFSTRIWEARISRDPRTGEPVEVPPKRHLRFRASKLLQERLNGPETAGE